MLLLGFSEAEAAYSPSPPEGLLSHPDPSSVCLLQGPPISLGRANAVSPLVMQTPQWWLPILLSPCPLVTLG